MAPSPEHDNEPKAPDKNDNKPSEGVELRTAGDLLEEHASSTRALDLQETSVSTLDDSQLKALLDEAITYKTPKDREGKSQIFKELLQEAEEDERNARAASASGPQLARYYNTAATRRHRNSTSRRETSSSSASSCVSARLTHGGSLQDLAQPDLYSDVVPSGHVSGRRAANSRRRPGAGGVHHLGHHGVGHGVSVSARQREGGSLPSNVNAGATYDRQLFDTDESIKCAKSRRGEKSTKTTVAASTLTNPTANQTTTTTTSTKQSGTACGKDKKMVEAAETAVVTASPTNARPDYTVVELGQVPDVEETRALLVQDHTPVVSYNSTSQCTPTVSVEQKDTSTVTAIAAAAATASGGAGSGGVSNIATWSTDNDELASSTVAQLHIASIQTDVNEDASASPVVAECITASSSSTSTSTNTSTFHHQQQQQQNALEEAIQQHRLPRLRYTSRATLELDGIGGAITTSNTSTMVATSSVDKSISFPQLHQHSDGRDSSALQLEAEYNSVRCIVESTSGNTAATAAASLVASAVGETQPSRQQMTPSLSQTAPTSTLVPTQYRLLSVSNPKLIHDRFQNHTDKKGLDENGNSVNTTSTALLDAKKKKKSKADRKVTVLSSEKIEGHRADIIEEIDLLVQFIEDSPIGGTSTPGKGGKPHHHHHHHHNVKVTGSSKQQQQQHQQQQQQQLQQQQHQQQQNNNNNKHHNQQQVDGKRRTRVKSKPEQGGVKKSNSLEEISKTKLEDLMSEDVSKCVRTRVKKQSTSEDGDRRSWGTEDGQQYMCGKISTTVYEPQLKEDPYTSLNILAPETAEFHVVTKKKKSKKRRSSSGGRHNHHLFTTGDDAGQRMVNNHPVNHTYNHQYPARSEHHHHHHHQHHHQVRGHHRNVFAQDAQAVPARRKSACSVPPSDKSNDSSDVDSVHSLPAAVHTNNTHSGETTQAQSGPGPGVTTVPASLTSYADIARTSGALPPGPVSNSSASSNCSSHSGGSSGNMNIQQTPPQQQASWKVPQVQQAQQQQQIPTVPVKNHVLLRSEHFPELCDTNTSDIVHRPDEFPSLDQLQPRASGSVVTSLVVPASKWTQVTNNNQQQQQQPLQQQQQQQQQQRSATSCKEAVLCAVGNNKDICISVNNNVNQVAIQSSRQVTSVVTHNPVVCVQRQPPVASVSPPQKLTKPPQPPPSSSPTPTDSKSCDTTYRHNNPNTHITHNYNSNKRHTTLPLAHSVPPGVPRRAPAAAPRPAVIILDDESNVNSQVTSSNDPIQVSGLTFGFELNEQLLNNSAPITVSGGTTPRDVSPCSGAIVDNMYDNKCAVMLMNNNSASDNSVRVVSSATASNLNSNIIVNDTTTVAAAGRSAPGDRFTARYLAPQTHGGITETYNHDKIVTYVGLAWEDVVHQSNGKVQYYNGQ